jgi:hypothetical protein
VIWRVIVANAVGWLYSCYKYTDEASGTFVFTGRPVDAYIAGEMYAYLIKSIERITKKNVRKNAKRKYRADFKRGLADALYNRIMEMGQNCSWASERKSNIKAVTSYVNNSVKLSECKSTKTNCNLKAILKGMSAAKEISLNRQAVGRDVLCLT